MSKTCGHGGCCGVNRARTLTIRTANEFKPCVVGKKYKYIYTCIYYRRSPAARGKRFDDKFYRISTKIKERIVCGRKTCVDSRRESFAKNYFYYSETITRAVNNTKIPLPRRTAVSFHVYYQNVAIASIAAGEIIYGG